MKRRRFIGLALFAILVAVTIRWILRRRNQKFTANPLEPNSLVKICGKEKILDLGNKYIQISGENRRDSLINKMLRGFTGTTEDQSDYLASSVENDFKENRTVVIDGWLLSITEARQCAVMSLEQTPR